MSAGKGKDTGSSGGRGAAKARAKGPMVQELKQELPAVPEPKVRVRPSQLQEYARYLLQNIVDRTSDDETERSIWEEYYAKFKVHAPLPVRERFEGILNDREWERMGRPVGPALAWVLYGIDFARQIEERIRPGEQKAEERAMALDWKGAIEILEKLIRYPDERSAQEHLLWCAMARVYDLLPGCCHLAFIGVPSSGKSVAMKATLALVNGIYVSDATEAYIARVLDDGRILGLDEVDEQLRAHEKGMLESILRQATDPKARRRVLQRLDDYSWIARDFDLYRPFVFTYLENIERALVTRTLVIRLTPNADAARIVRNFYSDEDLATVRIWLYDRAEEVRRTWTPEKVREEMSSPPFLALIDSLKSGLPRDKAIAAILLITAKMYSWLEDYKEVILSHLSAAAEDRISEEDSLILQELAAGPWHPPSLPNGPEWMWMDELLARVNNRRKLQGLRPLSAAQLGRRLAVFGLEDGKDRVKVRSEHGRRRILRTETVERLISGVKPSPLLSGATGATGANGQASLDEAAAPAGPVAPVGKSIEKGEEAVIDRELYDFARQRMFERPGETEDWYVRDLILAHQIPEKDCPAVKEIVHRAHLDYLRERTPLPEGDSSSTLQPDEGQEAIADSAKANQSEGPGNGANKLPEKGGTQL